MLKSRSIEEFEGPFNTLIARRMRQLGMESLDAFADYSKIGYTTLYNLVLGRVSTSGAQVKPSLDTLSRLSNALMVPLGELAYMVAPEGYGKPTFEGSTPEEVRVWETYEDPDLDPAETDFSLGYVYVEREAALGRRLYAYRVRTNAMAAGRKPIFNGDIVVVDSLAEVDEGDAVIALTQEGMNVCRMYTEKSGEAVLVSRNPKADDGAPNTIPISRVEDYARVVRTIRDD